MPLLGFWHPSSCQTGVGEEGLRQKATIERITTQEEIGLKISHGKWLPTPFKFVVVELLISTRALAQQQKLFEIAQRWNTCLSV